MGLKGASAQTVILELVRKLRKKKQMKDGKCAIKRLWPIDEMDSKKAKAHTTCQSKKVKIQELIEL
jgi:hypothetical protein